MKDYASSKIRASIFMQPFPGKKNWQKTPNELKPTPVASRFAEATGRHGGFKQV